MTKHRTGAKNATKKRPADRAKRLHAADCEITADSAVVTMERRASADRRGVERRKADEPVKCERRKLERRAKVARRRQIDPTTCERDYSTEEIEFMNALDQYKRTSGRMFPTCSEILEVIRGLGYARIAVETASVPSESETPAALPPVEAAGVAPVSTEAF